MGKHSAEATSDDDHPSGTQWHRVEPGAEEDPTVLQSIPEWVDPGPTLQAFEPLPGLLDGSIDEVAPGQEATVALPRPPAGDATLRLPALLARMGGSRRAPAPGTPDGAALAVKSGLAGLAVGLAILVPITGAAVVWSWWH